MSSNGNSANQKIKVMQIRSSIGCKYDQRETLLGLGLNKINRIVFLEKNPSVLGMIKKVKHLLKIENDSYK